MILLTTWLKPWTPPSPPLSPLFAVRRIGIVVCLVYSFQSAECAWSSLCYVRFVINLDPSFRYTTARFRKLSITSLALARSARCSSLLSLQRVWPDLIPSPQAKGPNKNKKTSLTKGMLHVVNTQILYQCIMICRENN